MDAQDRDEGKIRRRDEALARRFGKALDQVNPGAAVACPDPEIVAAYAEQSLHPDELELWESHFAKCARCRKILRVLAASADTPLAEKEVAQLGELVSAAHAPVEITANSAGRANRKLVGWRTRWLAPALGVAAVLAVWFAMRPPWRATNRAESTTLIAQAPKEEAPVSPSPAAPMDRFSATAPLRDEKTKASPAPDYLSARTPTFNSPAGKVGETRAEAGNAIKKVPASDSLAASALQKEEKFRNPTARLDAVTPSSPPPPPPKPSPPAIAAPETTTSAALPKARAQANATPLPAPAAPPPTGAPGSVNQTVTVTEAVPLVETTNGTLAGAIQQGASADLPVNGRSFQALDKSLPAREYFALLKAPSGSPLWRAGKGGIIERSTDAGKTWFSQVSPTAEDWLAGAAISNKACWLVGGHGAIARSTDGSHWKKIAPPAAAADASGALPDWLAVTATNKNSVTIASRDGRKFSTSDGGKTWRLQ